MQHTCQEEHRHRQQCWGQWTGAPASLGPCLGFRVTSKHQDKGVFDGSPRASPWLSPWYPNAWGVAGYACKGSAAFGMGWGQGRRRMLAAQEHHVAVHCCVASMPHWKGPTQHGAGVLK
jgi:hypothetical protein